MVNKNLTFQNASSLNGPLEEFIESIQCTKTQYNDADCADPVGFLKNCFVQCLLKNYCGSTVFDCNEEQILLFGISALIIAGVREKYYSRQSS